MSTRPALTVFLLVAIALTGCGRRGALEEPGEPGAEAVSQPAPRPGATPLAADDVSPGATEPPETRPVAAPERRFFLDPLI
jgi:predicted small lipoprotein YifL